MIYFRLLKVFCVIECRKLFGILFDDFFLNFVIDVLCFESIELFVVVFDIKYCLFEGVWGLLLFNFL